MAVIDSIIVFIVSLLVGALGIYIGAEVMTDESDYSHAIVTALIGAIVWALIGWIPLIGSILAFLAYVTVINFRYPGGYLKAIGIALVAWLAAGIVIFVLNSVGLVSLGALGVPGA